MSSINISKYLNRHTSSLVVCSFVLLTACSEKSSMAPTSVEKIAKPIIVESVLSDLLPDVIKGDFVAKSDCNIELFGGDVIGSEPRKAVGSFPTISGWVIDKQNHTAPTAVFLRVSTEDNQRVWYAPIQLSVERPDIVAGNENNAALLNSGFNVQVKAESLPKGLYNLQIVSSNKSEKAICDNGRRISFE